MPTGRLRSEPASGVTDTRTGRSIVCRVNDRGPFVSGRIVDLSRAAAARLGIISRGTARVTVTRN